MKSARIAWPHSCWDFGTKEQSTDRTPHEMEAVQINISSSVSPHDFKTEAQSVPSTRLLKLASVHAKKEWCSWFSDKNVTCLLNTYSVVR